jgi:hypothetical protein
VFAVLFMVGMTVAVWLSGAARQITTPAPAFVVNAPPSKPAPVKQVRKTRRRVERPLLVKPATPAKQTPVRVVKAQPPLRLAGEKPATVPLQNVVQVVKKDPPAEGPIGKYGTAVDFWKNPSDADLFAKKKDKLRFVLHISGNFEDPGCT